MKVTFLPVGKQVEAEEKTVLMELIREQGIPMDFVCGGRKSCGKCKVLVTKGNNQIYSKAEENLLTKEEKEKGYRLACCFRIEEDTCVILGHRKQKNIQKPEKKKIPHIKNAGIVFDIGTTTLEAAFVINNEQVLDTIIQTNPQRICGLDVISRTAYAVQSARNKRRLRELLLQALNSMIREFQNRWEVEKEQITDLVVLGNTTMIFLFLDYHVEMLAKGNFKERFEGACLTAGEAGLVNTPKAKLYVPGTIGGHVGSDTLGCILATKLWEKQRTSIIVDVGTNGEIALVKGGQIAACSTAAGPAFEGANIIQGMRAKDGAIYRVEKQGNFLEIKTVGNGEPRGICGTGLIDAAAAFLELGWMNETGQLSKEKTALDTEKRVSLWQQDIRQLQLAKSAVYSGIQVLLEAMDTSVEELDQIYIAGAFGSGLRPKNAVRIGLLPDIPEEKYTAIGNGSLKGGIAILKQKEMFQKSNRLAAQTKHIALAESERFKEIFIRNLNF